MSEIFISIIIFALLVLLHCLINTRKINRSRQILLPLVSLMYAVVAIVVAVNKYDDLIKPLPGICKALEGAVKISPNEIDVLYLNLLIYAGYILIRIVPLIISIIVFKNLRSREGITNVIYAFDDNCQLWLLRNKWTNLRELLKYLVFAAAGFTGVLMGLSWIMGAATPWHATVFPVIALLLVTECFNSLNGITEFEYAQSITGDDSYSTKIRNLYIIREIYEKIFIHELLTSETKCDYTSMKSVTDYLEELDESDRETDHKIAEFFRLNGETNSYDADYISATLKLLDGKNVVFFDPFYRDLGKYLILPVLATLLANKKCLIVIGRESVREDIIDWVRDTLINYGKIESLWRVAELNEKEPECEVGVLGFNKFYNPDIIKANADFFRNVGMVLMLEPSLIVNTGQIGLGILADYMLRDGCTPVYCFLDRITDGLVDSLSHVLQIEITEVEAPPVSRNIHTAMAWDADGDYLREKLFEKQTKYMGNGIELAAVAVKNQIPEVYWYSESKVPIKDIKWLAGQYFSTICKYMNLPIQQESLYDKVKFISNIWSTDREDYKFIIAEDEFSNMYNTMRVFLSRGDKQTFINVFSENYLLRDYMRCNKQVFVSNPDAIPSIVPDYAKTVRNTLIKMLFLMSTRPVRESEILNEFKLVGIVNDDANSILNELMRRYFDVGNEIIHVDVYRDDMSEDTFDDENLYSITSESFNRTFKKNLKNAFFICEDEDDEKYIDAKLFGHVTQVVLPGQFVVYEGKYYIVHSISPDTGVVLRRASNLYEGRKYYRQVRDYELAFYDEKDILSAKTVMDVELVKINASFKVRTTGYLELNKNHDLRTAREIGFASDPNVDAYTREYHNKTVLRVKLPDADSNVLFTISMLLSETLRSVFPDAWEYIAVTTKIPEGVDGMLNHLLYGLSGEVEDGYIYVFEDSELDLGLLEAIEKNIIKLVEIITDFLMWHFEKMREPASADAEPVTPEFPKVDYKKKSAVTEFLRRIGNIFGIKKESVKIQTVEQAEKNKPKPAEENKEQEVKEKPQEAKKIQVTSEDISFTIEDAVAGEPSEDQAAGTMQDEHIHDEVNVEAAPAPSEPEPEKKEYQAPEEDMLEGNENPEIIDIDGTDIFDDSGSDMDEEYLEECFIERGLSTREKSRYQKECFLKFGFNDIDKRLQIQDVLKYLTVRGFSQNAYRKARTRQLMEESFIDAKEVNRCDFCGKPLTAVSYERLNDGRIRCNDCTNSAITTVEDFRDIFKQVLSLMQSFFNISYNVGLNVVTTDAKAVARGYGSVFKPSTEYAARVLGYARKSNGRYDICIENGSPRLATILTMSHELTHIWQYIHWNPRDIKKRYPVPVQRDMVYEGMACWASIQYLYLIGELSYARDQEILMESREDVYGYGFIMFREKYPLIKDSSLVRYSPFSVYPPL